MCCEKIALNIALQMTANRTCHYKCLQMLRHIVTIALVQPSTNISGPPKSEREIKLANIACVVLWMNAIATPA
jgi:hypothetical protein